MRRIAFPTALVVLVVASVFAQQRRPAFDAASIRRNVAPGIAIRPPFDYFPTRFAVKYAFLRSLIAEAYGTEGRPLPLNRIIGGPSWIDSVKFDIQATTNGSATSPATMRLMLQTLLEERFRLRVHDEQRNLPAYALVMDSADGQLGPYIKPAEPRDCADLSREEALERRCGSTMFFDRETQQSIAYGSDVDITAMIEWLTGPEIAKLDRPVVDRTGLTGRYDFEVHYPPRDIFTNVRDQLGLRLEPVIAPIDVLVIDAAEDPTEDLGDNVDSPSVR